MAESLVRGDWPWFATSFSAFYERIRESWKHDIEQYGLFYLVEPWAEIVLLSNGSSYAPTETAERLERARTRLEWVAYLLNYVSTLNRKYEKWENSSCLRWLKTKVRMSVDEIKFPEILKSERELICTIEEVVRKTPNKIQRPDFLLDMLDKHVRSKNRSEKAINALLYGIAKSCGVNTTYSNAPENGSVSLLEPAKSIFRREVAAEVLLAYLCKVKLSNKTVVQRDHIDSMKQLYSLGKPSEDCWISILMVFIGAVSIDVLWQAVQEPFIFDHRLNRILRMAIKTKTRHD